MPRINTGPYKPKNDWTGFFIRGDQVFEFTWMLERLRDLYLAKPERTEGQQFVINECERKVMWLLDALEGEVGEKIRADQAKKFAETRNT